MGKQFTHLAGFPFQLLFVGQVLVLAAATDRKVRAMRLNAVGRRLDDFHEVSMRTIAFVAPDFGADLFARKSEGNKDDPTIGLGDASTEV